MLHVRICAGGRPQGQSLPRPIVRPKRALHPTGLAELATRGIEAARATTAIRRAHRDGLSIRQIARQLGVGRDTVRKALNNPEPKPYTSTQPRPAPTFGPFREIV